MSEKLEAQIATLLGRIATLEAGRAAAAAPQGIDPHALIRDPMGTFRQAGYTPDQLTHIRNAAIADFLGPNAPLPMQMQANMGPQMIATQQAQAALADLSRRFDEMTSAQKTTAKREEFKAISALKDKYPYLSKAISANPDRYSAALASHGGTAEEFATAQEAQLTELVAIYVPAPASTGSVKTPDNQDQSKKVASAPMGSATNVVPPPQGNPGKDSKVWNRDAYLATKEAILSSLPK